MMSQYAAQFDFQLAIQQPQTEDYNLIFNWPYGPIWGYLRLPSSTNLFLLELPSIGASRVGEGAAVINPGPGLPQEELQWDIL